MYIYIYKKNDPCYKKMRGEESRLSLLPREKKYQRFINSEVQDGGNNDGRMVAVDDNERRNERTRRPLAVRLITCVGGER